MNQTTKRFLFVVLLIVIGVGLGLVARQYWSAPEEEVWVNSPEVLAQERAKIETALAEDPDNMTLKLKLADLLYNYYIYNDKGIDEADEMYAAALEELEQNPAQNRDLISIIYLYRGNIGRVNKNYTGAIAVMEEGLEFAPDDPGLKYNIAYVYMNDLKDYETADEWMESIGMALANDPAFHYNRGRIFYNLGRYPEAEVALGITMTLDPKNAPTVRGDLYKKVLEAQGKELPADVEVAEVPFAEVDSEWVDAGESAPQ